MSSYNTGFSFFYQCLNDMKLKALGPLRTCKPVFFLYSASTLFLPPRDNKEKLL